jgi:tetratricopeptide (TPR) repeat protein
MKVMMLKKLLLCLLAVALCGCSGHQSAKHHDQDTLQTTQERLFDEAILAGDYYYALEIVDSLELTKSISEDLANAWRGSAYQYLEHNRTAEYYYKKAFASEDFRRDYPVEFVHASTDMGAILSTKGDIEGQLALVTDAYAVARTLDDADAARFASRLLAQIGTCQLWLGRKSEAEKNFNMAYRTLQEQAIDGTSYVTADAMAGIANNILVEYNSAHDVAGAELWLQRMGEAVGRAVAFPDCTDARADELQARLAVNRAIVLSAKHNRKEADLAYRKFLTYNYANTGNGLLDKAVYFEESDRWDDLERLQAALDSLDRAQNVPISMEYLKSSLGSRFLAELKSGRQQKALVTAGRIVEMLDTVDMIQRKNDASELAVIYETQEKEAQIAKQHAELTMQRLIGMAVAFVLVSVFFVVYTLHRRKAAKMLSELNAVKERIENELRIARNIQMSMVPREFPQRVGLDMYAFMEPAREVGGDLYNYVLQGDRLYFCVGDVSGKSVPASLFMAQSTRLFRTFASQGMLPADIATQMNKALSEDNEQEMFVTMFIGLADLMTGHLDFCNAGHNPPVLAGEFMEMKSNAPIGLWPELEFEGEVLESVLDRPLFIYTDGLNEAENEQQEQFGNERLLNILRSRTFENARQVIDAFKAEVSHHRQAAEPNDDLTMMCIRLTLTPG